MITAFYHLLSRTTITGPKNQSVLQTSSLTASTEECEHGIPTEEHDCYHRERNERKHNTTRAGGGTQRACGGIQGAGGGTRRACGGTRGVEEPRGQLHAGPALRPVSVLRGRVCPRVSVSVNPKNQVTKQL